MKKITIIIIILLFISNNTLYAFAESAPGTITVSGGSIGSGGVEGNSNVLKGTALTVIMATLASAGVTVKLAAEDYAKGNTALNYLEDKFAEWDSKTEDAWSEYEKYRALNETKVGADGSLYIPETASAIMQKFVNWLYANDDVSEIPQADSDQVLINGTYASDRLLYNNGTEQIVVYNYADMQERVAAFILVPVENGYRVCVYSQWPNFEVRYYYKSGSDWNYGYRNAMGSDKEGYCFCSTWLVLSAPIAGMQIVTDVNGYFRSLNGAYEEGTKSPTIDLTGFYGETLDIPQFVDPEDTTKITVVNPGLIQVLQDDYTGSNNTTINLQDYLDALKDLYGQQAIPQDITDLPDISIPGEDAITGTKEEVAVIGRDVVLAPDLTVPADPGAITWPEVPEIAVPVADPTTPADTEISIPAMSVDLTKIFPFCIPWDLYNLLSKFNADPVTPSITINWGNILGSIGVNFTTTLDLHDYDDVAAILRNMEIVVFVIGLAVATRQIFTQS